MLFYWYKPTKGGFVSNIAQLRKDKNMTQRQVAAALDMDISTVRNWEKGREGLKMFVRVAKLCDLFGCDPADLYDADEVNESEQL